MNESIKKIAALGLPEIILLVIIVTTGLISAAVIIAALAVLGGLLVMLGGIAVLGLIVVYRLRRQSEPHDKHIEEIDSLPPLNGEFKAKRKVTVTDGCGCETVMKPQITDLKEIVTILENVPGMTKAHHRDFQRSRLIVRLRDGTSVRTWKNPVGVDHVFLADKGNRMIYGGFVGWIHSEGLNQAIASIKRNFLES